MEIKGVDLKMDRKLRILPILGGIISLIALLFPAVYMDITIFIWRVEMYIYLYGYVVIRVNGITTYSGYPHGGFLLISIICVMIIITSSIIFIVTKNRKAWFGMAILQIIAVLIWLSIVVMIFSALVRELERELDIEIGFWDLFSVGFGIIGVFIGSILVIIGFFVSKPTKEIPIIKEMVTISLTQIICRTCGSIENSVFCTNCGVKL